MRATADREFMSEDEAKAFVAGIEFVNDGLVSVLDIEPSEDGYRVLILDKTRVVDNNTVCDYCDYDIPTNPDVDEQPYCNRHHNVECKLYYADND